MDYRCAAPLNPGDTIAVVAPSAALAEDDAAQAVHHRHEADGQRRARHQQYGQRQHRLAPQPVAQRSPQYTGGAFVNIEPASPGISLDREERRLLLREMIGLRRPDAGSAARFFYCAKASKSDRGVGNNHPTVKPTDLMRYLCRLVTPPLTSCEVSLA